MTGRAAILEIIEGVEALTVDPAAKREFRRLVRSVGAAHGLSVLERVDRVAFAADLLASRVSRPTIRDRLIAVFDVSRTHAYRIIVDALQLSQKQRINGTPSGSNPSIDNEGPTK